MIEKLGEDMKAAEEKLEDLRRYLDVGQKVERIKALEAEISKADFWKDQERSKTIIRELKGLKAVVEPFSRIEAGLKDIKDIVGIAEAGDTESLGHFNADLARLKKELDGLEFKSLLGGESDSNNAILSINAGAGGTESCDWAAMLLRMYTLWAEGRGYVISRLDQLVGEEAGIKSVTVLVSGDYAYGYLKSESGVHRLVRISPFDSNKRRHTSFASVDVIPEIADDIKVDIKEADLKIDTYRAGGKGGQHVNKTDSAVRITHVPTGIIVQCQNERSQFKNKTMALKLLASKLYEVEHSRKTKELEKAYDAKKEIAWGSQIRSYVLHPYSMVKDHRTDYETGNASAVLEGKLDELIEAYLKRAQGPKPAAQSPRPKAQS
ncbi:MAG: peptide chain release factor 2 [Candidatus Omnitrophota bacterium]